VVVIERKVAAEYDNYAKVDNDRVSKKVDVELDHKCDVKEIGTRQAPSCQESVLLTLVSFRVLICIL
jgi:hypothetical protein